MKITLGVIGGLMVLAGIIWGRVGYYGSQTPILIGLVAGGAVLGFIASKMPSKD